MARKQKCNIEEAASDPAVLEIIPSPPERDTVTLVDSAVAPALPPDVPYSYTELDDRTFTETLSAFVDQGRKQAEDFGLTLYYRILPGLKDAQRRFDEHANDPSYRLDGCAGIEQYIRNLGLKPATVRKWRQRASERMFMEAMKSFPGIKPKCKQCGQEEGHSQSCQRKTIRLLPQPETDTEKDILAKQCIQISNTLLGPSVEPLAERVKRAIRMAESVREAAAGGSYEEVASVATSPDPRPVRNTMPEPDGGSLEELWQRVSRMADTNDIQPAVTRYVTDMFAPFHQRGLILSFLVSTRREGRGRIEIGDWIELLGSGHEDQLGKVVGRDALKRPMIRWFASGQWHSPRSFFNNSRGKLHVLSAEEARDDYSDAFASYRSTNGEIEQALAALPIQSPSPEKHRDEAVAGQQAPNPTPSKVVHETFAGGPKVLEVTVPSSESWHSPSLKYYVLDGDQKVSFSTLEAARAQCDRIAERQRQVPHCGKPSTLGLDFVGPSGERPIASD